MSSNPNTELYTKNLQASSTHTSFKTQVGLKAETFLTSQMITFAQKEFSTKASKQNA
jgi:hypothetical protein